MPHSLSAAKRLRQSKKRAGRNKHWKSKIKSMVKTTRTSIASKSESMQEELHKAISLIDRAVTKGVLHKNTGARKKSRLVKHFNQTQKKSS